MAEADVTIAALSQVYLALKNFQIDANHISTKLKTDITNIYSDCEIKIKEAESKLHELRSEETQLQKTFFSLIEKKENEQKKFDRLTYEIDENRSSIRFYLSKIKSNPDHDPYIEEENEEYRDNVSRLEREVSYLESELFECEDMINSLEREIWQYEKNLNELKQKIKRAENKLQRLRSAYSRVKQTLDDFSISITRYAAAASLETSRNISAVSLCMKYIEEYMKTNL